MEIFLFILSALLIIVGIIGAVVPALPGPPLGYVGLLLLQFTDKVQFSTSFLVVWGIVVLAVTILDYLLPQRLQYLDNQRKKYGDDYGRV